MIHLVIQAHVTRSILVAYDTSSQLIQAHVTRSILAAYDTSSDSGTCNKVNSSSI